MAIDEQRPDPDALLARLEAEQARDARGRLKIFFGASPGVGKTYSMLVAARQLLGQGVDIAVGVVETHGRSETAALLDGLEVLALKEIAYKGHSLKEFDLDAALLRKPDLLLVDELAHSNAQGSRHPKRWQDVEELLAAGINVYTTVNVQHLDALNDVVSGITGIRVWETVPDQVFDEADELVLVDLPPDELLQRLKEGKVYLPQQAEWAIQNFFRKGNLIALRELALRRTADVVDDQMQEYRREKSVSSVWETRESLLACIGADEGSEKIVRSAARFATRLQVPWHAIYVETPQLQRLPQAKRQRILKTLQLAQEMGAETATLSAAETTAAIVDYARSHNLSKVVVGLGQRRLWRPWQRSLADRVGHLAPDLDVIQVKRADSDVRSRTVPDSSEEQPMREGARWVPYVMSALTCALATLVAAPLFPLFDLANIAMLFLLAVVLAAYRYGRGPAVLASFLSVAAFDFFYVSPRFSFAVSDVQYLMTFAVMLAVGLLIGQLTAGLKYQARVATLREGRMRAVYEMARDLSGALMPEQIAEICDRFVDIGFDAKAAILLADDRGALRPPLAPRGVMNIDTAIAQWAFDHEEAAGSGTDTLPSSPLLYVPLKAPMRSRGVLVIEARYPRRLMIPEQRRLLDAISRLTAIALERVHYVEVAQATTVQIESERLRNSLLSAISHDLRTPLTALVGLADALTLTTPALAPKQFETAAAIRDEALRMSALVNNLLDMARLQIGDVKLNLQWQPLEEVVGSSLKLMEKSLAGHLVKVKLASDLPLLEFDAVLMERVLTNLLENAAKYTPVGSSIVISGRVADQSAQIVVEDNGPGVPKGSEEMLFEKFTRGKKESATPGVGLGLAICKAIVEAHHGRIHAENLPVGGARFVITLPLGNPPSVEITSG